MSIQSINPATGQVLETFDGGIGGGRRARPGRGPPGVPGLARRAVRHARPAHAQGGRYPAWTQGRIRADHGARDGQADRAGRGRGREVRVGVRLLRRARRALPGRASRARPTPSRSYVRFDPLGRGAGGHAVELPLLAGLPLRRAGAHGGQRRRAQARLQRAALRARDRGGVPRRRAFREGLFRTLLVGSGAVRRPHRRPAHRRGDADRQRARGKPGRRAAPAARSRRPCSSWAAATRSSCSTTPTSTAAARDGRRRAPRSTAARAASPPSASSWSRRWPTRSSSASPTSMRSRRDGRPARPRDARSGPQARVDLRDELHRQVEESVKRGAQRRARRRDPGGPGRVLSADGAGRRWTRACRPSTRRRSARSPR